MLNQLASAVNFVWNYVNDLCFKHLQRTGKFFSAFDLAKYTAGASKELSLHSQTIQAITEELILRRKQFKKAKLMGKSNTAITGLVCGIAMDSQNITSKQARLSKIAVDVGMFA